MLLSLSWLLLMNVLILIFNLVPAFPLDGGRIARAVVWKVTGDKQRGTRVAALLGQGFAVLLAGLGLAWLLLLGFAAAACGWSRWPSCSDPRPAARWCRPRSASGSRACGSPTSWTASRWPSPRTTPVSQALDEYFLRYGWSWFPVVDASGRFMGIARQERVQAAHDGGEGWLTVGAVLEAGEASSWRVGEDRPLTEVLSSESLGRLGALMAVDGEGVLRGVVTIEQVRRALQSAVGSPVA